MSNYISDAIWKVILPDAAATEYTISGSANIHHVSLSPMGSPPLRRRIRQMPGRDGGIDQGFRLEPRRLVWELFITAETEALLEGWVLSMYELFKPYDEPIIIHVDRVGVGLLYQLNVHVDGPASFDQSGQVGFSGILRVPLYAPEPLWYSRTNKTAVSSITSSGSSFNVPTVGNYEEYPIIHCNGPVNNLVLTSTMTNAYRTETVKIDLTGVNILAGDYRLIDLRPGKKTVVDSLGVSKIGEMADESWPQFRIWPAPFKTSGINAITYTWTSRSSGAYCQFRYHDRFLSL